MAFQPKFNARFIGPIRDNILSYIQEHEEEALEWANDGEPMLPSKVYRRSLWYNTLLPALSVVAVRTRIIQDEDDARLGETHEIDVLIEDEGPDADALADSVEKRIKAIDAILRNMLPSDLLIGLSEGAGAISLDVVDHDYTSYRDKDKSIYRLAATLGIEIEVIEPLA